MISLSEKPLTSRFVKFVLAIILALFATRNLPWHLDDLDQAKQAYVSYQMVNEGRWLVQNTPRDEMATKPPLQGWISAVTYLAVGQRGWWEYAWRLPAFVSALLILSQLWRTGSHLYGGVAGSLLAGGMFGLNSYVPRLATLVRTDMMLSALIFFVGWLILEKLRKNEPWTLRSRVAVFTLLLASILTKGPIAYAFLLPGMLGYLWITRRTALPRHVFCGWQWWLLPLLAFGIWVVLGLQVPGFKEQVIDKEFLGRFTVGAEARHHNLAPGAYTLSLLGRTLPWTVPLLALFAVRQFRTAIKHDPAILWLLCWAVGGLLFMEFVPSKRFDRILPVLPPLCLLLAVGARHLPATWSTQWSAEALTRIATSTAIVVVVAYNAWYTVKGFRRNARGLIHFGEEVQQQVGNASGRLAVAFVRDEALAMYCSVPKYIRFDDAVSRWKSGQIEWLVVGSGDFKKHRIELDGATVILSTPVITEKADSYYLMKRN